MYAWSSHLQ
jgi:hypothetical protein